MNQCFYHSIELNLNKLLQDQGHIILPTKESAYTYGVILKYLFLSFITIN